MLPPNDKLAICFAHVAYQLHERFSALNTGIGVGIVVSVGYFLMSILLEQQLLPDK